MWSFTLFCLMMVAQTFGDDSPHETRIVGGSVAARGQFPHQAALYFDGRSYCSGALVSNEYILTTASCAAGINSSVLMVSVGSTTLSDGVRIPVARTIIHPQYNNGTRDNDVALLKTGISVTLTNTTQPIGLPASGRPVTGDVMVSGWGNTKIGEPLSNTLMYASIPVVDITQCKGVYGVRLTDTMVCVGDFENGGSGPCRGDTGGAAVQDGMVVGIVALPTCGVPRQPTVLTNVASPTILDFILTNTGL